MLISLSALDHLSGQKFCILALDSVALLNSAVLCPHQLVSLWSRFHGLIHCILLLMRWDLVKHLASV